MPGMSGVELARNLRVIKPELSVLLISGYMDDVGISASEPSWAYLQKPFTPEAVADKVREVLDFKPSNQKRRGPILEPLRSSTLK
jgi:DNA-binding NtrC family response regulator